MRAWSKEEAILRAQQLDLIYSQLGMLYKILPNAPQAEMDPTKETHGHHVDGIIGFVVGKVTSFMVNVSLEQQTNYAQTQTNPPTVNVLTATNPI